MRSSKPPVSRIPGSGSGGSSGSNSKLGGSSTPRGTQSLLSQSILLPPGTVGGSSRLPPTPSPVPPKFQPFKKAATPTSASPAEEQLLSVSPLESAVTPPLAVASDVGRDVQAIPFRLGEDGPGTPENDAELSGAASCTPNADAAIRGTPASSSGSTAASAAAVAATDSAAAAAALAEAAKEAADVAPLPGAPQQQQRQQRLEQLLLEAGFGGAGGAQPQEIQALAAAILAACKADAAAAAASGCSDPAVPPPSSSASPSPSSAVAGRPAGAAAVTAASVTTRGSRPPSAVVAACGAAAVCLAALAACMSWVVWVLVDRRVIGPAALSGLAREGFLE